MRFAFITEKRWNVESEGSFHVGYAKRSLKVEKFRGWYLFNIIPLRIVQLETEYYNKI